VNATADITRGVTGAVFWPEPDYYSVRLWLVPSTTVSGHDYLLDDFALARAHLWGLDVQSPGSWGAAQASEPLSTDVSEAISSDALRLAVEQAYVEIERPEVPPVTGDLLTDVQAVTGMTYGELGAVFGITDRAVAGWKQSGVPRHRRETLEALRAMGLTLIAGQGREGVHQWLVGGARSRVARMRDEGIDAVASEARLYQYSPGT
jgi:hypothetical protein